MDQTFTQGYGLVIGVGSYQQTAISTVPETVADAQAVDAVLRDPQVCGYPPAQVNLLADAGATRAAVLGALDALVSRMTAQDILFLFFAGHGDYGMDGNYYLLTHDAQVEWPNGQGRVTAGTGVSQQELLTRLKALPAGRMLLIFNACHSGEIAPALAVGDAGLGQAVPQDTATALLATGSGNVIITACRESQVSYIGPGPRTIFGQAVADGLHGSEMPNRNGYISAFDLYNYLYFTVSGRVQRTLGRDQEPELSIVKGVGPLAVARYAGPPAALGLAPPDAPNARTAAREVDAEESTQKFQQIVQGGQVTNKSAARDFYDLSGANGPVLNPTGPVTQTFGPQINNEGGVVNTGTMGNVQTGTGTQYNFGGPVSASRDFVLGSTINQNQYGGVRAGDHATFGGPVAGGNLAPAGLDPATRQQIKQLLDQLAQAADDARDLPRPTRLALMSDADAAKTAAADPAQQATLQSRVESIVKTLKTVGEGMAAAAPLYAIARTLAGLVGVPLP